MANNAPIGLRNYLTSVLLDHSHGLHVHPINQLVRRTLYNTNVPLINVASLNHALAVHPQLRQQDLPATVPYIRPPVESFQGVRPLLDSIPRQQGNDILNAYFAEGLPPPEFYSAIQQRLVLDASWNIPDITQIRAYLSSIISPNGTHRFLPLSPNVHDLIFFWLLEMHPEIGSVITFLLIGKNHLNIRNVVSFATDTEHLANSVYTSNQRYELIFAALWDDEFAMNEPDNFYANVARNLGLDPDDDIDVAADGGSPILDVLKLLNKPTVLAASLKAISEIALARDPTSKMTVRLELITRRGTYEPNPEGGNSIIHYKYLPNLSVPIEIHGTVKDIAAELISSMWKAVYGLGVHDSEFHFELNAVVVLYVYMNFTHTTLNQGHPYTNADAIPPNLQHHANSLLRELSANRLPLAMFSDVFKLTTIAFGVYEGMCVLEAVTFAYLLALGEIDWLTPSPIKKGIFLKHANSFPLALINLTYETYASLNLLDALTVAFRLCQLHFEHFMELPLCFFNGYGSKVPHSSFTVSTNYDGELRCTFPAAYTPDTICSFSTDEVGLNDVVLIYHNGHLFVSKHGQYLDAIQAAGTLTNRLLDLRKDHLPPPYTVYPREMEKKIQAGINRHARLKRQNKLSIPFGEVNTTHNLDKIAADFETGTCDLCSATLKYPVQHAVCLSLCGSSTDKSRTLTFVGAECPQVAKDFTFDTYNGCVTQFLRWIKSHLGVWNPQHIKENAPCHVYTRQFLFYNGGKFDLYLILKCLTGWNIQFRMLPMDNSILSLAWGNVEFLDFMKVYPVGSLDKCFKMFKLKNQLMHCCPPMDKWECFPYMHLNTSTFENPLSLEELATNDAIWGGKRCKGFTDLSIGQANAAYWSSNISTVGYTVDLLVEYAETDVLVEFWCIQVANRYFDVGEFNGRPYDTANCLTNSSRALRIFSSCFLNEPLVSVDLSIDTPFFDSVQGRNASLDQLFRQAYSGGKVDLTRHTLHDEASQKAFDLYNERMTAEGLPLLVDLCNELDVNSHYPAAMDRIEMPVQFKGFEHFDINMEGYTEISDAHFFNSADIYWISCRYPPTQAGLTLKYGGYSISPSYIPFTYVDCLRNTETQFSLYYGSEIKIAILQGARILVKKQLHFGTAPIFNSFVQTLYKLRLDAKAKGDVAMVELVKLILNSLYGKLAQQMKPSYEFITHAFDLPMYSSTDSKRVVHCESIGSTYAGRDLCVAHVADSGHTSIGQFVYIAGCVTAEARAYLLELKWGLEHCRTIFGTFIKVIYMDTDSFKVNFHFDMSDGYTKEFVLKYFDQTRLGALKWDNSHGYDLAEFLRKKTNFCHIYNISYGPLNRMNLLERPKEEFIIKSKGIPKGCITAAEMASIVNTSLPVVCSMPPSFRRSWKFGLERLEDTTRSCGIGNRTRMPPNANGDLLPYPSLQDFINSFSTVIEL